MLNYTEFTNETKKEFLNYLPQDYQDMSLQTIVCRRINQNLDGLILIRPGKKANISPTFYINNMYADYLESGNFESIMEKYADLAIHAFSDIPDLPEISADNLKNGVTFQLVNTIQNEDLLSEMVHRSYHDLSIVYRFVFPYDTESFAGFLITEKIAEQLGLSEKDLYWHALMNTRRIMGSEIISIKKLLPGLKVRDFDDGDPEMYIITNSQRRHGAALMMYDDILQAAAEILGDDLFILPSSIHEVIATPAADVDAESLSQMVYEINMAEVALEERLSNQVYYYDKDAHKLSLATHSPNKRLDGEAEITKILKGCDKKWAI